MTSVYYAQVADSEWLAVVAAPRMLLLKSAVLSMDSLWAALASPSGMQATLDELTRGGVSAAPPFALVEWESEVGSRPCSVRLIVRGDVTIAVQTAEGEVTTDASGVSTWLERSFAAATAVEVRATSARDSASPRLLPLLGGIVVTDMLTVGSAVTDASEVGASARPALSSGPAAPASGVPVASAWPDPEATVAGMTVSGLAEQREAPATEPAPAQAAQSGSYDYLFGETVFRKVEDAAVRVDDEAAAVASQPAIAAPESGDHDGHTIASVDIAKLRATRKARKAEPQAPAPVQPAAPALCLELADGSRESLAQPVLVGRAPSAGKVSGARMPRLLTVSGTDQDISRNHVQFAVEGGTVVVTDLHSRNGTMAILPGRSPQQLRQGEPTSVIVGTVIDLGGGVTFTVREE
ncbi:FHA domain-containing protein [Parafrigoribacterium soli]|uniref:FHA domain-containing protein n=1 Tax=Parafrigoribacterium soli TaxID=3144663 RepID=UPI0032EF792A